MNYTSIKNSHETLKQLGLFKSSYSKNSTYSKEFLYKSKKSNYIDTYNAAINNLDYDIILKDDSFFQFEERLERMSDGKKTTITRFAYFENPYNIISYEEYLSSIGFDLTEAGDEFKTDYEQAMSEKGLKDEFFSLRYDCSEATYKTGIHPYSHFHVGFRESYSIPINKHISPLAFVNFVVKSRFYDLWSSKMDTDEEFRKSYYSCKKELIKVHSNFFKHHDVNELFLT